MSGLRSSFGLPMAGAAASERKPVATLALIVVNVAVYAVTSFRNLFLEVGDCWVEIGGFAPLSLSSPGEYYRLFTSMFLHADFFHILFNMYFLYVFGRAVENALGRGRYIALYLLSGLVASVFHAAFSFIGGFSNYVIPAIGASGAISGVLGAYLILYPGTSLIMGWWFFLFPFFIRLKASYYLLFWFAAQVMYGYAKAAGSTAVFAHAGGFIAGIALLWLLADRDRLVQLRLVDRITPPYYLVIYPAKTGGLSRTTKLVLGALLVLILASSAYASLGLAEISGITKSAIIQYNCDGSFFKDYTGIRLPNIEESIDDTPLDTTRILLNRLYVAGLLYNVGEAGGKISIENQAMELHIPVIIDTFSSVVRVNFTVHRFRGSYDDDGFLLYGEGNIETQIIKIQLAYGPGNRPYPMVYYEPVTYDFNISSQTVNLNVITRYTALASLASTLAALMITLKKDRELTLVGEEPSWRGNHILL
ncbi:MAG: rhomboid family intramembrane serine protease [Candidatus Bathyarchaeia archaeon]